MSINKILLFLGVIFTSISYGETIVGFAPDFIGQEVTLLTYSDYLTATKVKISEGTVASKDSSFRLEVDVKQTIKVIIQIGNTEAEIYMSPDTDYNIFYKKKKDTPVAFAMQKATTYFAGLDSTDINYKILAYHNWFDEYLYVHKIDISRHGLSPYIDTFKQYAYAAYAKEKNTYFVNYVRYNIAQLERSKISKQSSDAKYISYLQYIEPFPVYPYNDQYMTYIKSYYSNDFNSLHTQLQAEIILAIDASSPSKLMAAIHKDPLYKKDELRELMMINMLGNAYYKRQYNRVNIQTMLDSVMRYAKFQENGVAAKNMLAQLTKVEEGYPAPDISFIDQFQEKVTFDRFKGKFIYVNFFTTWNADAVNEMRLMEDLYLRYNEYIEFVSICLDKDSTTFQTFINEHQSIQWPVVYAGEHHRVVKDYNVLSNPYYILLDQDGYIALAPAKRPTPDGVYETIEKTFKYIRSQLNE